MKIQQALWFNRKLYNPGDEERFLEAVRANPKIPVDYDRLVRSHAITGANRKDFVRKTPESTTEAINTDTLEVTSMTAPPTPAVPSVAAPSGTVPLSPDPADEERKSSPFDEKTPEEYTVKELLSIARKYDVDVPKGMRKNELIKLLVDHFNGPRGV